MPRATWNGAVIAEAGSAACQTVEGNTYFPPDAVNQEYLRPSTTRTECPWKGTARYFDVVVDGQVNKDAAWSYPEATDAAKRIESYVSFWKGVGIEPWTGGDDAAASLSPGSRSAAAGPLRTGTGTGTGIGSGIADFRLPDARGGEVSLADVLSRRRAVLVFYRGGWCPICNSQLAALSARYEDFRRRDLEILAIRCSCLACASCEVVVRNMASDAQAQAKAREYGIKRVPSVVVDGRLADCCQGGISEATLRDLGLGVA